MNDSKFRARWLASSFATSLLGLASAQQARAITIDFFSASTYSADTNAMDQALGISGLLIEDFEDTTLIDNLSITFAGHGFDGTRTDLARVVTSLPHSVWDGSGLVTNHPNNPEPFNGTYPVRTTFSYDGGASVFGIGLGGFQSLNAPSVEFPVTDHRLYVNGVLIGETIESLAGAEWEASRLGRNAYLIVRAEAGETIASVGFENIQAGGNEDVMQFDHLAVSPSRSVPVPVDEPQTWLLLVGGALVAATRVRRQAR